VHLLEKGSVAAIQSRHAAVGWANAQEKHSTATNDHPGAATRLETKSKRQRKQ